MVQRADGPVTLRGPRVRFLYIVEDFTRHAVDHYHGLLVTAEILLSRILLSQARGLRPFHLGLGAEQARHVFSRPRRAMFDSPSPEYRRWFTEFGGARSRPLSLEELAAELMRLDGFSAEGARSAAAARSWALPQSEQDWLIARSELDAFYRPLHCGEFDELVKTLEAIFGPHQLPAHADDTLAANREIARQSAALLGSMVDACTPPPFGPMALAEAFAASRSTQLACAAFSDPKSAGISWFLARRQRVRSAVARRT